MDRVIEVEGRKYRLPPNTMEIPFTDHNGRTYVFDQFVLHNPLAHKAFKFTTVQSVIKWWVQNREALIHTFEGAGYVYSLERFMCLLFDGLPWGTLKYNDLVDIKGWFTGRLTSPSLRISNENGYQTLTSILLPTEETEEILECEIRPGYNFYTQISTHRVSSRETMWDKKYNYTFKMNEADFNWWRKVNGENNVMFGMELEVSTKLSCKEIQDIVREVEPKQEPFFIFKQDGSITGEFENKVELVTVPCTPRYLRKNWKIFFQKLNHLCNDKGMSIKEVFDTRGTLNNGLHIHVSKESFMDSSHFKKFLTSWNQWNKSVVSLFNNVSQRPTDYTKGGYCKICYNYEGKTLARRLKGLASDDRMSVAHNKTGKTVEVRLYQGVFDISHIMKCISFTEAMFEFCQNIGYTTFGMRFTTDLGGFVRKQRKYAALYELFGKAK